MFWMRVAETTCLWAEGQRSEITFSENLVNAMTQDGSQLGFLIL